MTKNKEFKFTTTKKLAGEDIDLIVTYHLRNGKPQLHGNCTRADTGAPYPTKNWKQQLQKEAVHDLFERSLDNNLYQQGDKITS